MEPIEIQGITYTYVKNRLNGGSVYVSEDKDSYVRTGPKDEIAGEVNLTRDLKERGFPVPEVLDEGVLENELGYYRESAVGEKVFGEIFQNETGTYGSVKDESFDAFTDTALRYARAQFNSKNFVPHSLEAVTALIKVENALRNNPPKQIAEEKIYEAVARASERVAHLPWGYLQADLNAFNVLEGGIIDFELAGFGPIGYDIVTNVYFGKFWPDLLRVYSFSQEQEARYLTKVDALATSLSLSKPSEYKNDFLVLKSIWASGKDKESEENPLCNPQFWRWRTSVRDWCVSEYLEDRDIDTNRFLEIGGPITKHPEHIGH